MLAPVPCEARCVSDERLWSPSSLALTPAGPAWAGMPGAEHVTMPQRSSLRPVLLSGKHLSPEIPFSK